MSAFPFPSRELAYSELEQDPSYNKLAAMGFDIEAVINRAWHTGERAAGEIYAANGGAFPFDSLAANKKLTIRREYRDNVEYGRRYFSDYSTGKNEITLYMGSIEKWAEHNGLTIGEAENTILAHEYYHYLEHTGAAGPCSKQVSVPMLRVFGAPIGKTGVRALAEVGAHAFARTVYELMKGTETNNREVNTECTR